MAAGLVYHNFTTASGVTFAVACWVPDTTLPNANAVPVQMLMKSDGTLLDPTTLAQGGGKTLADLVTSLATNHTDELQLHTDIGTTLIAKEEAIRLLLAGTLAISAAALPLPTGAATAANQSLGSRPKVVTTTFTPAASGTYSNGLNIGGKLTFGTGLPAGTAVLLDTLNLAFGATSLSGAAPTVTAFIFNSNPASTFTDGVSFAVNAADAASLVKIQTAGAVAVQATNLWANSTAVNMVGTEATVDASGNIYVALLVGGAAPTYAASPGTATVSLGLRY